MDSQTQSAAAHSADARPVPIRCILGTCGHIDHGKTTLVKALTGTDTDRLPEEKQRGMTIELGFAELDLGDVRYGIVDVPGHERFVRTMVAGATGVDVALIIVAADDSVMPQTIEHVEILNLLGVTRAVVAITKCDIVDDEMTDLVEMEVHELLARTPLASAPIIRVSAVGGIGLDELRANLREVGRTCPPAVPDQPFRLPVDRVFSVPGRGTVVTGSVISGSLERGETVDIWPSGIRAKVRQLQSHNSDTGSISRGQRAAINLQGLDRTGVHRGDELATSSRLTPTRFIDARVRCLASRPRPIKNNARLRLCISTREVMARVVVLSGPAIEPGGSAFVQLRLREPVVATYGQHFILRDENAARTTGGGIVLRATGRRISARQHAELDGLQQLETGDAVQRVEEVYRSARFDRLGLDDIVTTAGVTRAVASDVIEQLTRGHRLIPLGADGRLISAPYLDAFLDRARAWLAHYHAAHPDEPGCPPETLQNMLERRAGRALGKTLLERLLSSDEVRPFGRYVCLSRFAPRLSAQEDKLLGQMLDLFDRAAYQPPKPSDLCAALGAQPPRVAKLIKLACAMGELVEFGANLYLHQRRYHALCETVRKLYEQQGAFSVAQLREALDSSRKYVVPLVEYLDRAGWTKRRGDLREWQGHG